VSKSQTAVQHCWFNHFTTWKMLSC